MAEQNDNNTKSREEAGHMGGEATAAATITNVVEVKESVKAPSLF